MRRNRRMKKPLVGLVVSSLILSLVSVSGHDADADVYKDQQTISEKTDSGRLVVSMGDSYSAGEGIEPFFGGRVGSTVLLEEWLKLPEGDDGNNKPTLDVWLNDESRKEIAVYVDDWLAHRSQKSWSAQLEIPGLGILGDHKYEGKGAADWYFVASSGAVVWHIFDTQDKEFILGNGNTYKRNLEAQIHVLEELNREDRVPDYITLTLGGNDLGFTEILKQVAIYPTYSNPYRLDAYLMDAVCKLTEDIDGLKGKLESEKNPERVTESVKDRLKKTYKALNDAAQIGDKKPCILVAGYPHLLNDSWNKFGRDIRDLYTNLSILDPVEAVKVNKKIDYFNEVLKTIVEECKNEGLNIEYIDVQKAFEGNEPYTATPWINGVLGSSIEDLVFLPPVSAYSIHPNEDGARLGYAARVQDKINELEAKHAQKQGNEVPTAISVSTDPLAEYDVVTFGRYEIDGNEQNGKEEIEWIVLEDDGEEMLLMSKEALDEKPYNEKYTMSVTWEQCSLRNWLNNDFYNAAFSGEEKNMIVLSDVENVDNPNGTDGGSSTKDRVYLLSIDEASWYLPTDDMRRSEATAYAVKNGVSVHAFDNCGWWLRSPGTYASEAADVTSTGAVRSTGLYVSNNCNGVRPVIRVKKSAVIPPYLNDDGYLVFGRYEQDNNTENGKEPIEWVVLEENEKGRLVISRYILDCVPFNNKYEDVTWETCSLREWLNNDFLNEAFSKAEQTLIPKVHLKNSGVEMPGGNDTEDQIFCLSLEEVAKYYEVELDKYAFFGFCKELITLPTEYAKANGLHTFRAKDCIDEPIGDEYWMDGYAPKGYQASITDLTGTYWWLRTMGWDSDACAVFPHGYVGPHYESGVSSGGYGVRPVIWIGEAPEPETETPTTEEETKPTKPAPNTGADVEINEVNFPAEAFREYVSQEFDLDENGVLSSEELSQVEKIYLSKKELSSLQGVEYFYNLQSLDLRNVKLPELDISNNTALTSLVCDRNGLTELDISHNTELKSLLCTNNKLTELDISHNTALETLHCEYNRLTALDVSHNPNLVNLICYNNKLNALDVSQNPALVYLSVNNNSLSGLDLSQNPALEILACAHNNVTALDITKNKKLESLIVDQGTQVTGLTSKVRTDYEK